MKRPSIAVLSVFLLAGCANPYRANFHSTQEQLPDWVAGRLGKPSSNPRLMTTTDIRQSNWDLFEKGYIMVGFSRFDGPDVDVDRALEIARRAGSDIVLVEKKFTKTLTETVAVTEWPASETTEIRDNSTIYGGERGSRQVQRRVEMTTHRGPETSYVPRQVDYYEHSATYWRRLERPIFGAFVEDLSDAQKQKMQTNRGLVVRAVMTDSPAFDADLLKGDILLKMNGQAVPGAAKFYEEVVARAGKPVEFSIRRGEKTLQRRVTLNP